MNPLKSVCGLLGVHGPLFGNHCSSIWRVSVRNDGFTCRPNTYVGHVLGSRATPSYDHSLPT